MSRPKKQLISRKRTLEIALRIIDEEGLDALSIRRLGRELNVQGISLYHHFANKEAILVGACELALADVRTPDMSNPDYRTWLLDNAIAYRAALLAHPNLITVLMRRHPLRIGLAEENATAGLLAVQGVPPGLVMPVVEAMEELALGSVCFQSSVQKDDNTDEWRDAYPYLYHLSRNPALSKDELFRISAKAIIDVILGDPGASRAEDRADASVA